MRPYTIKHNIIQAGQYRISVEIARIIIKALKNKGKSKKIRGK